MNEIKNLKEFKKSALEQSFTYCNAIAGDGKKLINRNRFKKDFEGNLDKIIKKLDSNLTKNGTYIIQCSMTPSAEPEVWVFHKGGVKTLGEGEQIPKSVTIVQQERQVKSPDVLSYDKALEYQNTISELRYEVKRLEMENKALTEEIEELEAEEEEIPEGGVAETGVSSIKSIIENILATAMPVLDRHLTIKEKQLEIERLKLGGAMQQRETQTVTNEDQKILTEKINVWLEKVSAENNELYDKLENLSAQVRSLEEWLVAVKTNFPEAYSELDKYVTQN